MEMMYAYPNALAGNCRRSDPSFQGNSKVHYAPYSEKVRKDEDRPRSDGSGYDGYPSLLFPGHAGQINTEFQIYENYLNGKDWQMRLAVAFWASAAPPRKWIKQLPLGNDLPDPDVKVPVR